jgi:hypothetical protein
MRFTALRKVFLVGHAAAAVGVAGGFAVLVVDVDQVDVARHVELARAQLAHADHPQLGALAFGAERRAVHGVELVAGVAAGDVQGQLGQLGDGGGHHGQRGLLVAIKRYKPLHRELPHNPQGIADAVPSLAQCLVSHCHRLAPRRTGGKQCKFGRIPATQALHEA